MIDPLKLSGLRVATFEARRAKEIGEMLRRHGAEVISAPALREVPMSENREALEFARCLARKELDVVILLTGVGTRFLTTAIETELPKEKFGEALRAITTVARGPKPVAVLWELFQLKPTIAVPEPNTWREVLATIDKHISLQGKRVAVQEYGASNPEFLEGLAARGAEVLRVPIYRWALPEDTQPLRGAIAQILAGKVDVALFMSATQAEHLFQIAGAQADALRKAFTRVVVASIGPICTEAIKQLGVQVDIEPAHSKMGHFVVAIADRAPALLAAKRT